MILYTRYFNEWDCPPEGIDTISIWVHPNMINRFVDFHEYGNIHESINCRWSDEKIKKTGQFIRRNYFIDFQAEALNPYEDILGQIINYLTEFVHIGTLKSLKNMDKTSTAIFFMYNFSRVFAINSLDFYFDLKDEDCLLLGEVNKFHDSRYSLDYPSSLKIYSREMRLKQKNNIPYRYIEQMEYKTRIEFHLANANCDFLDYQNLQGTFEMIFLRYLPQLARKWFTHRRNVVQIPYLHKLSYACHLKQVNELAFAGHIPWYRNLFRTPPRPIPEKHYRKNETDINWLSQFITG